MCCSRPENFRRYHNRLTLDTAWGKFMADRKSAQVQKKDYRFTKKIRKSTFCTQNVFAKCFCGNTWYVPGGLGPVRGLHRQL